MMNSLLSRFRVQICSAFSAAAIALPCLHLQAAESPEQSNPKEVSFYRQIRPIFQANCHGCHQPAKAKGGYVMTVYDQLLTGGEGEDPAIIPSDPDGSYLIELITPINGEAEMPQKAGPLAAEDITLIRRWIAQGAKDDTPANAKARFSMGNPPTYTQPPLITSLDFSPNGELLAVAGFHEVLLHRADGGGLVGRLVGLSDRIESVRFSPDGSRLAVTGGLPARMGEIQVWDIAQQELSLSVPVTFDTIFGASWSPDGKLIAFGCTDNTLRAIDAKTGEQVLYQGSHDNWVIDTVFTRNGDHVISVGRDRTAKLTELITQRFIDNLTSITPGALKSGLVSVARHPHRDEFLVGAADGTPQIYRVFRETKRVIGDNANLVRQFSSLPGRIFAVDYGPQGKRIVAGSSLNGMGTVNIYSSDFDGTLSKELKTIMEKTVSGRSAEEKLKVAAFRTKDIRLLAHLSLPTGIYALSFHPGGNTIAVGGADGIVRLLDGRSASIVKAFIPVPLLDSDPDTLLTLHVEPAEIDLQSATDYNQLVVTGWTNSGEGRDLTRQVSLDFSEDLISISPSGIVKGKTDGATRLRVSLDQHAVEIPVRVHGLQDPIQSDYVRDLMPAISKMGCNAGTCHGSRSGKNGFKLSLRGYDPIYDVRAFTDDLFGRRINFASPDDSLMLLKATAGVPHEGGQLTKPGEDYYKILRAWIANGAKLDLATPRVTEIRLTPSNPVVQNIGDEQQMRVVARYADGKQRDVTREAFIDSGNGDVVKASESGLISTLRRGEAPILARFEGAYAATTLTVMGDRESFVWEEPEKFHRVDELVTSKWKRMKIRPSGVCTDAEFLRRVYLDLTGLPPTSDAVRKFLADERDMKVKRDELIDSLIGNDDYVDYWANKWADLLQVNRKFLGIEGAALFREWIHTQISENTPYDELASQILTAEGSNRDNPAASYYKILRNSVDIMEITTHLFLATRFNCNKCHDHPFERWTQDQYYELSAYFSRVGFKTDPASKGKTIGGTAVESKKPLYEVVFDKSEGEIKHDRTGQYTAPSFPYAVAHEVGEDATRRQQLAAWITSPDNPYFAKSYVNRVWGYLFGIGIIEPIDDIRAGNPASNPELLEWLTEYFIASDFDVRKLIRTICQSRTYQLSIETNPWNEDDTVNFSHAIPKRLPAEVLYDAIYFTTGATPEFPGVPKGTRATQLPDSGVKLPDGFLGNLGRPSRESACECERSNELQLSSIMALVSGPTVDRAISDRENAVARLTQTEKEDARLVDELFMRILNRPAREQEIELAMQTLAEIKPEHERLITDLKSYEKQIAPVIAEREQQRQREIDQANQELADFQAEIAPREAELEKEHQDKIAKAESELNDYQTKLPQLLAEWEQRPDRVTEWTTLKPKKLSATNGATLTREKDLSVIASGDNGQGQYDFVAYTDLNDITGVRLEMLADERLPKNGPGRHEDGNFVLSEFEVSWADRSAPSERSKAVLKNAKADFSQKGYAVNGAIDGKNPDNGNGWAIHAEEGKDHQAIFEFEQPIGKGEESTILTFALKQNFQTKTHSIGRFRLSVTRSEPPFDFGVPGDIAEILSVAAAQRNEEQTKALLDFYRSKDEEAKRLDSELAKAKKPRPINPKVKELQAKVERVSKPLREDPYLVDLRRAVKLSTDQMERQRMTAAQDLAWALINNPAFLFNH